MVNYVKLARAFLKLGCTKNQAKNLVAVAKNIAKEGSLKDYVNSSVELNKKYTTRLFSRTPPRVGVKTSDNVVIFRQIVSKCSKFSDIRIARAFKCIQRILDEVLLRYNYVELPIGGCANHTLTPASDLDIPVITDCPDAGRNQLATIAMVVGLVEVCKEIPCGATFSVRFVDDFLTAQFIDQHFAKTALICSMPPSMLKKQMFLYENFLTKGYAKLRKMTQGRTALDDCYCTSLRDYDDEIQKKVYSGERVSAKDLLKLLTLKLHFHLTKEKGLNLLRGRKFSDLFFEAAKSNPVLESIQEVLGSVLKKAKMDPDKEILSYMISKEIAAFFDIVEENGLWFS